MAKDEFIKINLELIAAYPVMGSDQPFLEVTNRAVCQRKHRLRTFAHVDSQRLRASHMLKSSFLQPSKALEAVGMYSGAWHHILFQENSGALYS